MNVSLRIPAGWFGQIKSYLFDGSQNEFCCYLFCGVVRSRVGLRLVGRSFSLPDKQADYVISHGTACRPTDYYMDNILFEKPKENDSIRNNLAIVDIHSHPFAGKGRVGFSGTDDNWQQVAVDYFYNRRNLDGVYCFIVMGEDSFDGRVFQWDKKKGEPVCTMLSEIVIMDYPFRRWPHPSKTVKQSLTRMQQRIFDRQIRAFGKEGQKIMSGLTAGIVGLGGIGSIAAEGLARLGVNRFVLVDHDRVEISNLNRLQGMTRTDAVNGPEKTAVSARTIMEITPSARVNRIDVPVQDKKSGNGLKTCDFIIVGTDNIMSRAFMNEFCLQYGIPLFSAGTVINMLDDDAGIQDIFGEYFVMVPGDTTCCLKCAGLVDYRQVSYQLSSGSVRGEGKKRGYIDDPEITQPAVRPLNGAMTEMMLSEIHNYFCGFKGRMDEGFAYDQKSNLIHRRFYLHPELDVETDGMVIEGILAEDGFVEIRINGGRPYRISLDGVFHEQLTIPGLSENAMAVVENYLYRLHTARDQKKNCTLCSRKGRLGLGENEPMTRYPVPPVQ
jgi:hypothetical protein